jgi:hypothetical protein
MILGFGMPTLIVILARYYSRAIHIYGVGFTIMAIYVPVKFMLNILKVTVSSNVSIISAL